MGLTTELERAPSGGGTLAERKADANRRASLAALRQTQPWIAESLPPPDPSLRWLLGRDGSLTARRGERGRWLGDCSLPHRAARRMFRDLDANAPVCCLLAPIHAGMIRVVLDTLRANQALLVIVPDPAELAGMLACEDFSSDLSDHRLWFVGSDVLGDIDRIYTRHPGLPVPGQFIRPSFTSCDTEQLIASAQQAISRVLARVPEQLDQLKTRWRGAPARVRTVCVVAPSHFRLWRDTTPTLLHAIAETDGALQALPIDTDRPTYSAPLAVAFAAVDADAVLSADLARGDIPGMVEDARPWVTWITTRRVPTCVPSAERDRLVLVDASLVPAARAAGWQSEQLVVAGWPELDELVEPAAPCEPPHDAPPHLLIAADLGPTAVPVEVDRFSSHAVLWNAVLEELTRDPSALREPADAYLADRARRFGIDPGQLQTSRFLEGCIASGFAIGIARLLSSSGVPLRIAGVGWEQVEPPPGLLIGPVTDRRQLFSLVRDARAVVNVMVDALSGHPVHACGVPVMHAQGRSRSTLLSDAQSLVRGHVPPQPLRGRRLSGGLLQQLLAT
jgi:hypothetical protein